MIHVLYVIVGIFAFGVLVVGIKHGLRDRKQMHIELRAEAIRKSRPRQRRTIPTRGYQLDSADLEEMEGMFGSAGDSPKDY